MSVAKDGHVRKIRDITADDMVLAFVKAEVSSSRWGGFYSAAADDIGVNLSNLALATHATLSQENAARAELLGRVRGYGCNAMLFTQFPSMVSWEEVRLDQRELGEAWYARCGGPFVSATGSRAVRDSKGDLGRFPSDIARNVGPIGEAVVSGLSLPPLIAVRTSSESRLVLVEGHTRATAYVAVGRPEDVPVLLGTSPQMDTWAFW